jgi:hypothetical protein
MVNLLQEGVSVGLCKKGTGETRQLFLFLRSSPVSYLASPPSRVRQICRHFRGDICENGPIMIRYFLNGLPGFGGQVV